MPKKNHDLHAAALWSLTIEAVREARPELLNQLLEGLAMRIGEASQGPRWEEAWRADLRDRARWSAEALDPTSQLGRTASELHAFFSECAEWDISAAQQAPGTGAALSGGLMPPGFKTGEIGAWKAPWSFFLEVEDGRLAHPSALVERSGSAHEFAGSIPTLRLFEALSVFVVDPDHDPRRVQRILAEACLAVAPKGRQEFISLSGGLVAGQLDGRLVAVGGTRSVERGRTGAVLNLYLEPLAAARAGREVRWRRQPTIDALQSKLGELILETL